MRKNEKRKKKIFTILMIIILISNILFGIKNEVQAYELGDHITILTAGSMTCLLDTQTNEYVSVEYMNYQGEDGGYPAYHITDDGNPIYQDRISIYQGLNANEEIRKILYAGYPYHSYSDLGCTEAYQAYLATQLVILEYTQGEDLSKYTATNERGEEALVAIQKIKQNLANQGNLNSRPEIYFYIETNWETYENNENYMVKKMQVQCSTSEYMNPIDILVTNGTGIYFTDTAGIERTSFYPSEEILMILPNNLMENQETIKIKAFLTCETNQQFIAQATTTGESFVLTKNPIEIIEASYQEQVTQVEEPENPNNPEEPNQENPENSENSENQEEKEELGEVNDKENEGENDKISNDENINENQNNNENNNNNQNENQNQNQSENSNQNISQNTSKNETKIENKNININENKVEIEENTVFEPKLEIILQPEIQIEITTEKEKQTIEETNLNNKKQEIFNENFENILENTESTEIEENVEKKEEKIEKEKNIETSTQNSMLKTENLLKTVQKKLPRTGY